MSSSNSWLRAQRKSDLVDVADGVGLTNYEGLKKAELEIALEQYLSQNSSSFSDDPRVAGFYQSQARSRSSPIKKEPVSEEADRPIKVPKRRVTKAPEEFSPDNEESRALVSTSNAVLRTPRVSSLAARIPLPASPADVAQAVDRSTVAVRKRVASIYQDSGVNEAAHATRESLSTVTSVLFTVAAFELFFLRREVLADRYAFTIPAIAPLGTNDYPVHIPDMFLLLTSSFWSPTLLWLATSLVVPATFGYFYNLSVANQPAPGRGRRAPSSEYTVDPLTFSIVKALVSYVVYAQGVTFGGLVDTTSIDRINGAVYGGWKGVLVGSAVTGLVSLYDAILRK